MLGKVDLVMGSFSKTFASNGGFVACHSREVKEYLRYYSPSTTFSNALSPIQSAVVLKAFEIVNSQEGETLRGELMANILSLRKTCARMGRTSMATPQRSFASRWAPRRSRGWSAAVCLTLACSPIWSNIPQSPRARPATACK